ncbi:unnamed protein product [Linum tenue]|uniref:Uncharacterized protein n=1 Tax=Linum tenue TaxID=586396 RepID=A0AAV0Q6B1_9ROSI|nr:unnamed protein product [Linum tenue]
MYSSSLLRPKERKERMSVTQLMAMKMKQSVDAICVIMEEDDSGK